MKHTQPTITEVHPANLMEPNTVGILHGHIHYERDSCKGDPPCKPLHTSETIDITPVGMTSPEGCKRVAEAQQEWDMATHALANSVQAVIDELMDRDTDKITRAELYSQLQTLIGIRGVKQEAFLRAVAGR